MGEVMRLSPPTRPAHVDPDAIEALEAALGPQGCAEAVEDALLALADRLGAIDRALAEDDWTGAARAARDLAEAAGRIGLAALEAQARALTGCCACLDGVAAHAVGARLLRTGEAALADRYGPAAG